eukprot:gene7559-7621_t
MSAMKPMNRRAALSTLASASLFAIWPQAGRAQSGPEAAFGFEDVIRRARELASVNFAAPAPRLPESLQNLSYDDWRDIRFKPEKALFSSKDSPFRLQLFHLGHLYKQPVVINLIRDGIAAPIPYTNSLFDYGHNNFSNPFPVNLGFAGFRLHTALNQPNLFDELIAFLGASYFRLLGRGQHFGLSARGLALPNGSDAEEFPAFNEFWVETPAAGADHATIYALMDSPSLSGAYRFDIYPGVESIIEVTANLFPRKTLSHIGIAPLTSMFFTGASDARNTEDYRPQLHDSDGLLMHSGTGEWIWRPLRNPRHSENSTFVDRDIRGFGLMQRDRSFEHYQDLDLAYERRPSYWVQPRENWGEGRIELVELPTSDETNDNIVAMWVPAIPAEAGKPIVFGYRLKALLEDPRLSPGGQAQHTFQTLPRARGAGEAIPLGATRFIVDFAGGDLAFFLPDPNSVELVPTTTRGKILRSFMVPNPHINGFRAAIDVQIDAGQSTDLRAFLKSGTRTLTETWTLPYGG